MRVAWCALVLLAGTNLLSGEATYQGHRLDNYAAGQQAMLEFVLAAAADLARPPGGEGS